MEQCWNGTDTGMESREHNWNTEHSVHKNPRLEWNRSKYPSNYDNKKCSKMN